MSDVGARVLARLDEVEAVARAATAGPWTWQGDNEEHGLTSQGAVDGLAAPDRRSPTRAYRCGINEARPADALPGYEWDASVISAGGYHTEGFIDCLPEDRAHIALNDPAHVLRWVAAMRAVVELHAEVTWTQIIGWPTTTTCAVCQHGLRANGYPCATIAALASIWPDDEPAEAPESHRNGPRSAEPGSEVPQ